MFRKNLTAAMAFTLVGTTLIVTHARAEIITLVVNDAAGQSSFLTDTLNHWSPAGAPVSGNTYVVPSSGSATLSLRTGASVGSEAFAGDVLQLGSGAATNAGQLVLKNLTNSTITIPQIIMDNGRIQNGGNAAGAATTIIIASPNAIEVSNNAGFFDSGTTGRVITINPSVTNNSVVVTQNAGTINFVGGITGGGAVNFTAGSTSVNLPSADFTSPLGTSGFTGGVSFVPLNAHRNLNIGGASAALTWGTGGFSPTTLTLNGTSGTHTLTVLNPINLGSAARNVVVGNGAAEIDAVFAGGLGNNGTNALTISGGGRLLLNTANNFGTGSLINIGLSQSEGVVRADHDSAFGNGTVQLDTAGNSSTARVEFVGNHTYANPINLPGRNNTTVGLQNVSGNNVLTGKITLGVGGSGYTIQSDAGLMTLSGGSGGDVAITAVSGNRTVTLQGAGNGLVSGVIENGGATTVAITKAGAGTWTLSGVNTYTGPTTVSAGSLVVNGSLSALSTVSIAAAGSLGGTGSVLGNVNLDGTLAPGVSAGTLLVDGNLAASTSAVFNFELSGTSTAIGSGVNDLIDGVNALTLAGVLNIAETVPGSFLSVTNASWRLFNYSGTLTDNGLVLGSLPAVQSGVTFSLDFATPGQVNLVAVIPEPSALGLLVPAVALMGRRRK